MRYTTVFIVLLAAATSILPAAALVARDPSDLVARDYDHHEILERDFDYRHDLYERDMEDEYMELVARARDHGRSHLVNPPPLPVNPPPAPVNPPQAPAHTVAVPATVIAPPPAPTPAPGGGGGGANSRRPRH